MRFHTLYRNISGAGGGTMAWEHDTTEMASDHVPENVLSERAHHALDYKVVQRIVCLRKDL